MRNVGWGDGLTGRSRSFLVTTVVVLLAGNVVALAAHDGSSTPSSTPVPDQALITGSAPSTAVPSSTVVPSTAAPTTRPTVTRPPAARSAARPASSTTTSTTTTPWSLQPPTTYAWGYVYQVVLEPTCAGIGEEFTITFHLKPGGGAVLIATYADDQNYETKYAGTAGADGRVVYKWKAPPAPGEGTVWTQASDPEQKRKGQTNVDFRIVELPGTC